VAQRNEAVAALREAQTNERSVVTGSIPQANAQDEKALRDARAKVANTRATYARRQVLYERGGISKKTWRLATRSDHSRRRAAPSGADSNSAYESLNPTIERWPSAHGASAQHLRPSMRN